jgi:hypothetical protein
MSSLLRIERDYLPEVSSWRDAFPKSYTYLLGDSRTEAARLRAQARLWDPTAHALFDRLKIRRGTRVLEIGPGAGSLHRELRRRVRGPSTPWSHRSVRPRHRTPGRADGVGHGQIWRVNLATCRLPRGTTDVNLRPLGVPVPAGASGAHVRSSPAASRPAACWRSRTISARRCA